MDLRKHAANAVAGLRDLSGEVVIEAAEHGEFGELLVGHRRHHVVECLASKYEQSERIGLQQRWQVSASTLRTASGYPGQTPISDHQPPTRPGDNTPRIMTATGGENHAGPGWP